MYHGTKSGDEIRQSKCIKASPDPRALRGEFSAVWFRLPRPDGNLCCQSFGNENFDIAPLIDQSMDYTLARPVHNPGRIEKGHGYINLLLVPNPLVESLKSRKLIVMDDIYWTGKITQGNTMWKGEPGKMKSLATVLEGFFKEKRTTIPDTDPKHVHVGMVFEHGGFLALSEDYLAKHKPWPILFSDDDSDSENESEEMNEGRANRH